MKLAKEHIKQLPIIQLLTTSPRDSDLVSISIPIFHSPKGIGANYDDRKNFNIRTFQDVVCKGAAWTAHALMTNTDLAQHGVPIYFHVEDKVYDATMDVLSKFGVPETWIKQTSFQDPEHELDHWLTGKKLAHFYDDDIQTKVKVIWDSDSFVFRAAGQPVLEWYRHFEADLSNTIMTSFHSTDNGGQHSYTNWLLRAIGLPEIEKDKPTDHELRAAEATVYEKSDLPMPTQQHRWGASVLSIPMTHPILPFLQKHYHESRTDEGLISIWMNAVGSPFIEFDKLFVPILKDDTTFLKQRSACIAHPQGSDEQLVVKYQKRLEKGIDGIRTEPQRSPRGRRCRIHVFSVPHNPSHKDYSCCAFGQKARKLPWMLDYAGHEVYHYGNELSDVRCTEHISVTTETDLKEAYGDFREQSDFYKFSESDFAYKMYNLRLEHELRKRFMPGDFLCYVFAPYQKRLFHSLQDLQDARHVESGIGYFNSFMKYRVFESPGLRAYHYGYFGNNSEQYWALSQEEREKTHYDPNTAFPYSEPPVWDAVIPNSFDVEDFEFRTKKDDYFLYLGRIIPHKGVEEAMRIAAKLGKKLVVAGQGDFEKELGFKPWKNVELVGPVNVEQRKALLSNAIALFCLSRYWEAFGGVHIEAMLSGTPPISTDLGGYVHTIRSGYNGYRLNMNIYEQGVWAAKNADKIDPYNLRDFGLRFSNEQIALRYDEYFDSLSAMIENDGSPYWIENPSRTDLDWIDYDRQIEWTEGLMTPVDE